jgi:CubicO group peptidase (beta-lactamase class C family)
MKIDQFDQRLDRLMTLVSRLPGIWPVAGGVISIVSRDAVLAIRPFGLANRDANLPANASHLYEIGSISKIFTGMLAVQLVAEGKLDLDAPVTTYLPWLEVPSAYPMFTIRHLLHHSSGLVKGADDPPDSPGQSWSLRRTVTGSAPGSHFHYSNLGYILLGLIIKKITGQAATDLCRSRLLQPAGMTASLARVSNKDRHRLAIGYMPALDDQPWAPGDDLAPATWFEIDAADGNVASSGTDMARFVRLLLGRGSIDGATLLAPAAFDRLIEPAAPGGEDWVETLGDLGIETSRYGLGINVETIRGHHCLSHGGGMVGYSSFVLADLTADLGIAVLSNANGDCPMGQIIARLAYEILTTERQDFPGLDLAFRPGSARFDPAMLGDYASPDHDGLDDAGKSRAITIGIGQDLVTVSHNGLVAGLYQTWSSRLVTDHPDLRRFNLTFEMSDGQPRWLHGATIMTRADQSSATATKRAGDPAKTARLRAWIGRYRSYSPWYPTFRIVLRDDRLFLIAPGGVEAPTEDVELIELEPGILRIGAEPHLPERLIVDGMIDGKVVTCLRDGCRHSLSAFA